MAILSRFTKRYVAMIKSCEAFVLIPGFAFVCMVASIMTAYLEAVIEVSETSYERLAQDSKFEIPEAQRAIREGMLDGKITIAEYKEIESMADAIEKQTNKQNLIKKLQENHQ